MKLLIHVFIDSFDHFLTETNFESQQYWDDYGASNAIDNVITDFPQNKFVKPQTINYTVKGAKAQNYNWAVSVASFAQRKDLSLTKWPTVMFYDVDTSKYVARLEGTPHTSADVKAVLIRLFAQNSGGNGSGNGNGTTTPKPIKKLFGYGGFAALLLLLLKKKAL